LLWVGCGRSRPAILFLFAPKMLIRIVELMVTFGQSGEPVGLIDGHHKIAAALPAGAFAVLSPLLPEPLIAFAPIFAPLPCAP
jgi:hypothetical protein